MKLNLNRSLWLGTLALFFGIASVELLSEGMFLDGLTYADIARNMAEGRGSFWRPHFSHSLFPVFYEHPPLALGLQSLFFRLFGDNIYVERFYALLTMVLVGSIMVQIWAKLTKDRASAWFPLFLWLISSGVLWAAANNMLENTMNVFIILALLFYLNSYDQRRFLWIALAGFSLSLALLSKGFVGLYLWSAPFFFWLFLRKRNLWQSSLDTMVLLAFTIGPIAVLYFGNAEAQNHMSQYFAKQVVGSIENVQTTHSRFSIVGDFFKSIAIPLVIGLIIVLVYLRKASDRFLLGQNLKPFWVFFALSLSGVLPIMISLKQSSFYIVTVYPIFALGWAFYLYPMARHISRGLRKSPTFSTSLKWGSLALLLASSLISI